MDLPSLALLKKRLKFWRKILGLKRWRIDISYGATDDAKHIAEIEPLKCKKTAQIVFSTHEKYHSDLCVYYDFILLHELCHVIFANRRLEKKISENQCFADLEEYICDMFAASLCRAHGLSVYDEKNIL